MARFVKIATIATNPCSFLNKPINKTTVDYVLEHLQQQLDQVLSLKPDLILLPECCDRPDGMPLDLRNEYYAERKNCIHNFFANIAKEHNCYIAYGTHRLLEDGTARNSLVMVGRNGEYVGAYDKNHIVPAETPNTNVLCGKGATIFDCDFGRVGSVICFDLNFSEIRERYKALQPDLMLFSSNFGGGLMRNFFAFDVGSYFVSACAYNCTGVFIDPLGQELATTSNHYNYAIQTLNLDYAVVHLDNHWDKIRTIREKYNSLVEIKDIGYVGVVLMSYLGTDKTMKDILKEFDIITAKEYFDFAIEHRKKYTER